MQWISYDTKKYPADFRTDLSLFNERPHFNCYSQYERLNAFFAEIHDTGSIEFEAGQSYLFKGIFNGKPKVIDGSKAPALTHKQEFLSCVQQQLNS